MLLAPLLALAGQAAEPPPCRIADAVPASVREMARDPGRWLDRCVRIEGYALSNIFYADVGGYYASRASNSRERANDGWLGLYLADGRDLVRRLRRGTVTGRVSVCGRGYDPEAETDPNVWVFSVGYCHYRGGLILHDARFRAAGPAVFERQLGAAARARFGDLEPEAPQRPVPAEVAGLADRFLAALRAGDGPALRAMAGLWSEPDPADAAGERALLAYLLGEGGSPWAALRASPGAPQRAFFREMAERDEAAEGRFGDWHVCFCKAGDCDGLWPVSAFDASAAPERPYLCLIAYHREMAPEPPDRLAIERRDHGLGEPAR